MEFCHHGILYVFVLHNKNAFDSIIEILEKMRECLAQCTMNISNLSFEVYMYDNVVYSLAHTVQNIIFNQ